MVLTGKGKRTQAKLGRALHVKRVGGGGGGP